MSCGLGILIVNVILGRTRRWERYLTKIACITKATISPSPLIPILSSCDYARHLYVPLLFNKPCILSQEKERDAGKDYYLETFSFFTILTFSVKLSSEKKVKFST